MNTLLTRLASCFACLLAACSAPPDADAAVTRRDVVVYGDSSGAVTAAIAARELGLSVVLVNPTGFLGGMSASGLGATDFLGQRATFGGIASRFYDGVAAAYGRDYVRSFEPKVGRQVFERLIAEAGVEVVFDARLDRRHGVAMEGARIVSIRTERGEVYRGEVFIDASYVGDLMAAAGVPFTVGRESARQYGEDLAGVRRGDTSPRWHYGHSNKDHFVRDVDPFVTPGDPGSGLLPGVFAIDGLSNGQGDDKIQAYNYRVCLTTDPELRIPIDKPDGYRELDHELLLRNFEAGDHRVPALIEQLAGGGSKVDWNHRDAVGSDYAAANWEYPEASYARRREIEAAHQRYIRGLLWTLSHHERVPAAVRERVVRYGLPKDEFVDNGGWPYMIYIREARRMVSDYVMTQHECEGRRVAPDPVGLASFGMDSHVVQYFVDEHGHARRDGTIWRIPPRPYGVSYRSIVPPVGSCENLLVPVCLSATHVAHGSIRMEPVFMALSESAATAAAIAVRRRCAVQDVRYDELRQALDARGQIVALPGRVVSADEGDASLSGAWLRSKAQRGYYGGGYLHDGNAGKGACSARFQLRVPAPGRYEVQLAYTSNENRASNVPVTVRHLHGDTVVVVDQRQRPSGGNGRLHPLGTFRFEEQAVVEIETKGTDGYVIVDTVQLVGR